jgi:hypothetical protein
VLVVAVPEGAQGHGSFDVGEGDAAAVVLGGEGRGYVEGREHVAGVTVGAGDEVLDGVVVEGAGFVAEPARIGQGAGDEVTERVGVEGLEAEQGGAGQQRAGE